MKTHVGRMLMVGLCAVATVLPVAVHAAATLIVQNNDGGGEGFNDPAAFVPVGGNPATTRGAARLNAFQYAADLWGACINSNVVIVILAEMNPLTCTPTGAVLGSAGAGSAVRDFGSAPVAGTWYSQALANALEGVDVDPGNPDIVAQFNSSINGSPSCLASYSWYYGYDGNPGVNQIDFVTVVLHEIGHGLGFQTYVDLASGAKLLGFNDTYMLNLARAGATPSTYPAMSNSQRVSASTSDPNLRWTGASATAEQPNIPVTAGLSGAFVRVHAPNPQQPGSSVSHWSSAVTPDESMEPAYAGPNHNMSLALNLMEDIGWTLDSKCPPELTTIDDTDTLSVNQTASTWQVKVELHNAGVFDATNVTAIMTPIDGWLSIPDANCAYGALNAGAASFGVDSYTLDISGWPGGPFQVELDVAWEDDCGNPHNQTVTVGLQPEGPTTVGGSRFAYELDANVPNPFNPSTTIRYQIGGTDEVTLRVYDVAGHLVRTLVDARRSPGTYAARWDGRDEHGRGVASGVYFYQLRAGDFSRTRRMVLLK
jgi:hypothetical protein